MKRLLALALVLVLTLSLSVTAFAAQETYTITAPAGSHKYEVYQIFTGDYYLDAQKGAVLSNVKWGANGTGTAGAEVDDATLDALEALKDATSDREKLNEIEQYADLTGTPAATVTDGGTAEVVPGYYLIKDEAGSVTGNDAYTLYIVKVVGDVTIAAKSDLPEVEKKVKDTNDTTGVTSDWQDSADYDIGDTMSFKLTATLPDDYADYKTYSLTFTDTFENMEQVTVGKVYLTNGNGMELGVFTANDYAKADTADGFTVTFADLKTSGLKDAIGNSDKVVVEYTAVLADTAALGAAGNDNKVKLTYTNDPNYDGTGTPTTGETPEDKVVVFTYKLTANKVDEEQNALEGAGFTLYKQAADGAWAAVGDELTGAAMTTFEWKGLDDGTYKLVETTTPRGYNTMKDIVFVLTATHDIEKAEPQLTELKADDFTGSVVDGAAGTITADIENKAGAVLPSTGGMGTTLFYTLGGALVLAAVVLLITKKRMQDGE